MTNTINQKTFHLYSDGNHFPRAKKSGFGGYIQDADGTILAEYTSRVKQLDYAFNFELLGIIQGLELAQQMGVKKLISHCDDKTTAGRLKEIMQTKSLKEIPINAKPELFERIFELSHFFDEISFEYIPRHLNKHSDNLSRRYSVNMEKNFLNQYKEDLAHSEKCLKEQKKINKTIFFSHPSMIKINYKNNPFLVAPVRNKHIRKVSRVQQQDNYEYLFVEFFMNNETCSFKAFEYDLNKNKKLINSFEFLPSENKIHNYCHFLTETLEKINHNKLWIHTNFKAFNDIFDQKDKISINDFLYFKPIYNVLDKFEKTMFNHFPFDHEFSTELLVKEKAKKEINEDLENVEKLMEQIQFGNFEVERKKAFGLLIRHHLRKYKETLERDLDEVEKQDIILKTNEELTAQGIEIPKFKMK